MERRLIPVLAEMERAGIMVDEEELRRLSADFGERMAVAGGAHPQAGRPPFNLGSPKVLGEILFDEMKLPGGRRTGSGTWGTDAAVLQQLAEGGAELPGRILEWRQLAKLKSTYADALVTEINRETGRVHTTFAMAAAATGRLSSNDPNLQNIPIRTEEGGRIRQAFVAAPGHVLVSADYSQIELRLLAHVADVPALSEAFATGQDIHSRTASEVFGVPMAEMTGLIRRRAKAINFGIIYGISAFGLGRQLGIEPGEAKELHRRLLRPLPRHPRLHGEHAGGGAHPRLRADPVRPALLGARHRRPQPGQARLRRAPGKQCAASGRGGRYHQARDGQAAGARWPHRGYAAGCCFRCMTNCCSRPRTGKRMTWLPWRRT